MKTDQQLQIEKYQLAQLQANKITLEDMKKSKTWFDRRIAEMRRMTISPKSLLNQGQGRKLTTNLMPGKMYSYFYDPKHKDTLPYYDTFPLIFPFQKDSDGFTGINLHYLTYAGRVVLFRELLKVANTKSYTDMKKLNLSWDMIMAFSKLAPARVCVKRYLYDHVRSPFIDFPTQDWATVLLLPTHRFVGATDQSIWNRNARTIRGF